MYIGQGNLTNTYIIIVNRNDQNISIYLIIPCTYLGQTECILLHLNSGSDSLRI